MLCSASYASASSEQVQHQRRGLPGPGEPLEPYVISVSKYSEREEEHAANGRPEKARSAEWKKCVLQTEDTEQMRVIALNNFAHFNDGQYYLVQAMNRKSLASKKRRAYRDLLKHIRSSENIPHLSDRKVQEGIENAYGTYIDTMPERIWQRKAVEAAHATGCSAEYFDPVRASHDSLTEEAEALPSSSSMQATDASRSTQLGGDVFKAVVDRDKEAAMGVAAYQKKAMFEADEEDTQIQKECKYYQQKDMAWTNLAANIEADQLREIQDQPI